MKYVVIDTEGSGVFDYKKPADAEGQPRLAALSMIFLADSLDIEREAHFLVKPDGWVMPKEAEEINGLSTEFLLANGVPVVDALNAYAAAIADGYVVVAHNAQHDCKQVRAELRRASRDDLFERTPNICTMRALVGVCRLPKPSGKGGYKFPKLSEAMAHFKIPQAGAHTARGDARDCLALLRKIIEIGVCPQPDVHRAQEGTKAGEALTARGGTPEARPDQPATVAPAPSRALKPGPAAADDELPL